MNVIVEREKGPLTELGDRIETLRARGMGGSTELGVLEEKYRALLVDLFGNLTPWERVNMARHPKRPTASDYLAAFDRFDELHGDRHFRDDPALIGGFAKLRGRRIVFLAQQKGRDTKENIRRNFGMVSPEGYRKAKRLMELASRFGLPIVTLVDTSGADPGIASEEHAQSEAIAACLAALAKVHVPVVATIIGEGGSGGALAIGVGDVMLMMQYSSYSVISPEGCASILWKSAAKAPEAAETLGITAARLKTLGLVDKIVSEPLGGAHRDPEVVMQTLKKALQESLRLLQDQSLDDLLKSRFERLMGYGKFKETAAK